MTNLQHPMQPNPIKLKVTPRLIVALTIGAIFIFVAVIYNSIFPEEYWSLRQLEKNQAKWESQHITHYRMSVYLPYETTYLGQLPMPLTVEVKDGNVISVVDAQGEKVLSKSEVFTVLGLFSYAYQYYLEKPPLIKIAYDPTLGFPNSIYIDPYTEPCCQDFEIAVQEFQALP